MKKFGANFIEKGKNIFISEELDKDVPLSEIKIWRYMDLCKFFSIWRNNTLYFCNRKNLADKRECGIKVYQKGFQRCGNPFLTSHIVGKNSEYIETKEKLKAFVNCWSLSDHENYLLWNTYLQNSIGVAIQTNLQDLINSITELPSEAIYISKVQYVDSLPLSNDNEQTLFMKHICYKEENELRLGILSPNPAAKRIRINPNTLIEAVYVSPLLETDMQEELYRFLTSFLSNEGIRYSDIIENKLPIGFINKNSLDYENKSI